MEALDKPQEPELHCFRREVAAQQCQGGSSRLPPSRHWSPADLRGLQGRTQTRKGGALLLGISHGSSCVCVFAAAVGEASLVQVRDLQSLQSAEEEVSNWRFRWKNKHMVSV